MNQSVNGNTTRMALERIAYDLQVHEPDVVVVQFGMNDCNVWASDRGLPRVSGDAFCANLREIIQRSRTFGARTVIVNTNHPSTRSDVLPGTTQSYASRNRAYNRLIRATVSGEDATTLVDVERAFEAAAAPLAGLLLEDGVHLSPKGHDSYVAIVGPAVARAVGSV
jgi:lysophospholipase L1-like esterase